jgi:hypothetical protein
LSDGVGENTLQPASSWVTSDVIGVQDRAGKDSVKQSAKLPNKVGAGWQAQPPYIFAGGDRPDDVTVIQ